MCMGVKSLGKSAIAGVGTRYVKKKYDKEMEPDRPPSSGPLSPYGMEQKAKRNKIGSTSPPTGQGSGLQIR